ncbi:MAG: ACT domain-containing protein [Actinomycetota bacterium]
MKDLTVVLENRPGTLASLGESLGKAGVNIEGFCGFPAEGQAIGHLLVEDAAAARQALEAAGAKVTGERDILVVDIENRAGTLGQAARKVADAGVNIDLVYVASDNRVVVGADDLDKARAALG